MSKNGPDQVEVVELDDTPDIQVNVQSGDQPRDGAVVGDILQGLGHTTQVLLQDLLGIDLGGGGGRPGRDRPRQDGRRPQSGGGGRRPPGPPRNQPSGRVAASPPGRTNQWLPKAKRTWGVAPVIIITAVVLVGGAGLAAMATKKG